ncbi:hypothetical protein GOP47_0007840, partial [Adiantum capillus-veneris]
RSGKRGRAFLSHAIEEYTANVCIHGGSPNSLQWYSTTTLAFPICFELGLLLPAVFPHTTRAVHAQGSVQELRDSYNFLQAGLSTLAAGASVALCLARGRLDSEMHVVDFFTMTRFKVQNKYGSQTYTILGRKGVLPLL